MIFRLHSLLTYTNSNSNGHTPITFNNLLRYTLFFNVFRLVDPTLHPSTLLIRLLHPYSHSDVYMCQHLNYSRGALNWYGWRRTGWMTILACWIDRRMDAISFSSWNLMSTQIDRYISLSNYCFNSILMNGAPNGILNGSNSIHIIEYNRVYIYNVAASA